MEAKEYTIDWMEIGKTSLGKTKATATLLDEKNQKIEVTIWSDFPGFVDLKPGSKVTGKIRETYGTGGKTWKSLSHVAYFRKPKSDKGADMVKAVEIKQKGIDEAQDKKADGIKTSSTFRAAVDSTIQWRAERQARGLTTSAEEWQEEFRQVRAWFSRNWELPF